MIHARRKPWHFALLTAAIAVALAIAGCGGGDEEAGDPAPSTAEPDPSAGESPAPEAEATPEDAERRRRALAAAAPLGETGTPPTTKGGDNSIQRYGEKADEATAGEIEAALAGYLGARARGDWKGACALLAAGVRDQLAQLSAQAEGGEAISCERFLKTTAGRLPERMLKRVADVDLGSVRAEGDRAFAIFTDSRGDWQAMPMARDDAGWAVSSLSPSPLQL